MERRINLLKYVQPLGWIDFFIIKESHYPKATQSFYFMAKTSIDISLIISNQKGNAITHENLAYTLNLPTEGATLYGDTWDDEARLCMSEIIKEMLGFGLISFLPRLLFKLDIDQHKSLLATRFEYKLVLMMCYIFYLYFEKLILT